jgi:diguanylate cyclase (GGDEF)-like protein
LILEDIIADAELIERELREVGIEFSSIRVATKDAFLRELKGFSPDIILADHSLLQLDGLSALSIAKEQSPDTPFIIISSIISADALFEAMKSGATDFIFKQRLSRLVHSVPRALREARERTERKRAEEALEWELKFNTAIADLASALLAEHLFSIDEISNLVLEHARKLTKSIFGYVGYIDQDTKRLVSVTLTKDIWDKCNVKDKAFVFEKFSGLWGWVLNNKQPLLTNSPSEDPRSTGIPPGHIPINRFLSAPAMIGENLVGQIALANSERDYTERDLSFIIRLASLYAIAVQRKWSEEKLYYLSMHDALTGLYNRSYFEQEMQRIEEGRFKSVGIVVCDIDGLKLINDTLGHQSGDELLKASAKVIKESFRKGDVVARIGGDEFAVIIPNADKDTVKKACLRTRDTISEYNSKHSDLPMSISIGYAFSNKPPLKMYNLFKKADNSMYKEKLRQGKRR